MSDPSRAPTEPLDVSDLVADSFERVQEAAARTPAAQAPPSASASNPSLAAAGLPHSFCLKLGDLLRVLTQTFEERTKLSVWYHMFQTTVLGNPERELEAIKRWHHEMMYDNTGSPREVDLYDLTEQRRIDELLSSDFEVFKLIEAHSLYFDPDLFDEDRELLCKHFDNINALARMFSCVPTDMLSLVGEKLADLDPSQGITLDTLQSVAQTVFGCAPSELGTNPEAVERLQSWAVDMCHQFRKPGAIKALQTVLESAPAISSDMSLGPLLSQFTEEIMRGAEVVDAHGVDSVEMQENDALRTLMSGMCSGVFSSLGGGGGGGPAGAGSGAGAM